MERWGPWSGPVRWMAVSAPGAALEPCGQGAKPSAKQPAALGRGIAGIGGRDPSRDPSDGADLGNGAAGKSRYNNNGIK